MIDIFTGSLMVLDALPMMILNVEGEPTPAGEKLVKGLADIVNVEWLLLFLLTFESILERFVIRFVIRSHDTPHFFRVGICHHLFHGIVIDIRASRGMETLSNGFLELRPHLA